MSVSVADRIDTTRAARGLLPLCVGAGVYLFVLVTGDSLLQDSDSFWQIGIGQWIIDHAAMPHADFYSFTHAAGRGSPTPGSPRCCTRSPMRIMAGRAWWC